MEQVKGYKRTELGLIPEEWKIHKVKDLIDLLTDYDANGSFESVAQNVNVYDHEEYAWYVRSTDLENNSKLDKVRYVDESSYKFLKKTSLYGGELLFLKRGDIGNVYLFEMKTPRATVAPNLYLLKLNQISDSKYLYYYFISNYGQRQLKSKNASSTLGALYKDDVKSILVLLPPTIAEQTSIATALSNIDELISQTEKLIEKKKAIKQGVMQELLKPKKGWVTKMLGDLVSVIKSGGTPLTSNNDFYNGEIPFLSISDMTNQGKYLTYTSSKISQLGLDNSSSWLVPKDSLIYSMYASVGFVSISKLDIAISQAVLGMQFKNFINIDFMYYTLLSMQKSVFKFVGEGTQKNLNAASVKNFNITYPSISLQKEIAEILNDLDSDIALTEKKLQKLKHQKKGMMQSLLTGKIRLI